MTPFFEFRRGVFHMMTEATDEGARRAIRCGYREANPDHWNYKAAKAAMDRLLND